MLIILKQIERLLLIRGRGGGGRRHIRAWHETLKIRIVTARCPLSVVDSRGHSLGEPEQTVEENALDEQSAQSLVETERTLALIYWLNAVEEAVVARVYWHHAAARVRVVNYGPRALHDQSVYDCLHRIENYGRRKLTGKVGERRQVGLVHNLLLGLVYSINLSLKKKKVPIKFFSSQLSLF